MANVQEGKEEIIKLLQQAVDGETASRNLYWLRAAFWHGKGLKRLGHYYGEQARERHAWKSAERMILLGAQPALHVTPVEAIDTDSTIKDLFEGDLAVEKLLAKQYDEWIEAAMDAGDFVTEDLWRKILKQTQAHVDWLTQQISQIEMMGEDNYLATWRK